jgi:hypothetical protein
MIKKIETKFLNFSNKYFEFFNVIIYDKILNINFKIIDNNYSNIDTEFLKTFILENCEFLQKSKKFFGVQLNIDNMLSFQFV